LFDSNRYYNAASNEFAAVPKFRLRNQHGRAEQDDGGCGARDLVQQTKTARDPMNKSVGMRRLAGPEVLIFES
jgi:hypothetical protein